MRVRRLCIGRFAPVRTDCRRRTALGQCSRWALDAGVPNGPVRQSLRIGQGHYPNAPRLVAFEAVAAAATSLGGLFSHYPAWHGAKGLLVVMGWVVLTGAVATALALLGPRLKRVFGPDRTDLHAVGDRVALCHFDRGRSSRQIAAGTGQLLGARAKVLQIRGHYFR
jgi:hypothetical protein